jgi:hypothetical protein
VTFNNLLSMFFTRDVKHKLQQDTYIQRARMFGSRNDYLKYFELTIPRQLYLDWQSCFIFHRLSLASRKQSKQSPVWLDGERVAAVAPSSIDKARVVVDKGEMSFDLFDFDPDAIAEIASQPIGSLQKLQALAELLGPDCVPPYLVNYIQSFLPDGDKSLSVHPPISIAGYSDKAGETNTSNNNVGKARVFYKYHGSVRFLKTQK